MGAPWATGSAGHAAAGAAARRAWDVTATRGRDLVAEDDDASDAEEDEQRATAVWCHDRLVGEGYECQRQEDAPGLSWPNRSKPGTCRCPSSGSRRRTPKRTSATPVYGGLGLPLMAEAGRVPCPTPAGTVLSDALSLLRPPSGSRGPHHLVRPCGDAGARTTSCD